MKNITKIKIKDVINQYEQLSNEQFPVNELVNSIAKIVDDELIKVLLETFQFGELLETMRLKIVNIDDEKHIVE